MGTWVQCQNEGADLFSDGVFQYIDSKEEFFRKLSRVCDKPDQADLYRFKGHIETADGTWLILYNELYGRDMVINNPAAKKKLQIECAEIIGENQIIRDIVSYANGWVEATLDLDDSDPAGTQIKVIDMAGLPGPIRETAFNRNRERQKTWIKTEGEETHILADRESVFCDGNLTLTRADLEHVASGDNLSDNVKTCFFRNFVERFPTELQGRDNDGFTTLTVNGEVTDEWFTKKIVQNTTRNTKNNGSLQVTFLAKARLLWDECYRPLEIAGNEISVIGSKRTGLAGKRHDIFKVQLFIACDRTTGTGFIQFGAPRNLGSIEAVYGEQIIDAEPAQTGMTEEANETAAAGEIPDAVAEEAPESALDAAQAAEAPESALDAAQAAEAPESAPDAAQAAEAPASAPDAAADAAETLAPAQDADAAADAAETLAPAQDADAAADTAETPALALDMAPAAAAAETPAPATDTPPAPAADTTYAAEMEEAMATLGSNMTNAVENALQEAEQESAEDALENLCLLVRNRIDAYKKKLDRMAAAEKENDPSQTANAASFTNDEIRRIAGNMEKQYDRDVLERFLCAMHTNQIIILHGKPGLGKTTFVRTIAKALDGVCEIIPVRPNWIDNQDLLGFYNPIEHKYAATPFLDAICDAIGHPEKQFFICLDEMNLAHIEYYFSDILSVMESGDKTIHLYSKEEWATEYFKCEKKVREFSRNVKPEEMTESMIEDILRLENLKKYRASIQIPDNIQFVGTLNMDETTKGLSPKVIDRSYILELTANQTYPPVYQWETSADKCVLADAYRNGSEYLENMECLQDSSLQMMQSMDISRRIERQIEDMLGRASGCLERQRFADYVIAGKILPKINADHVTEADLKKLKEAFSPYRLAIEKLERMWDPEEEKLNYWLNR